MDKEFDKKMEYQKGIEELYNETEEFGRIDFVKVIFDLREENAVLESHMDFIGALNRQLDRREKELNKANNKLDKVKQYCINSQIIWFPTTEERQLQHSIMTDIYKIIIGGE